MENTVLIDGSVCCICFENHNEVISLHTEEFGISLYEELQKYTNSTLNIDNDSESLICRQCFKELKICVQFLNKCMKASEILKHSILTENEMQLVTDASNICEAREDKEVISKEDTNIEVKEDHFKYDEKNNDTSSDLSCQYCYKVFTRKSNLKLHESRHVSPGPPPPPRMCPVCGRTYTSYTNLNNHLRKHTGERPFVCSLCGKAFGSKKILTDHSRIHTGVKPYMCPICGKQFTTNKLSTHMRRHEPGQSKSRSTDRSKDPSTRRGEHACSLCPARYNHKQSLNKHVRKVHGPETTNVTNDTIDYNPSEFSLSEVVQFV